MMVHTWYHRSRFWLGISILVVMAAGLASRKFPALVPAALGQYPGDTLWALMVFTGMAFVCPSMSPWRLAGLALLLSLLVEISQLYQADWINTIRATTLGHLALGSDFDWLDLVALAVGVAIGSFVDAYFANRVCCGG
jgi:hypothetical protein